MADPAEDVLQQFIQAEKWRIAGKNASAEHRLRAWFVWRRADALKGQLSGSALFAQVKEDHDKIIAYIETKLGPGPKYETGPLVPVRRKQSAADGSPPHLDLLDLARQRTDDPTDLSNESNPRVRLILRRAEKFTAQRVRFVLQIVWRAAVIDADTVLWNGSASTLDTDAMDEILNRRLRAVERMSLNVSSQEAMMGLGDQDDIPRSRWTYTPNSNRGWFDGFRVRLFEYPKVPGYTPVPPQDVSNGTWLDHSGAGGIGAFLHDARMTGTRVFTGGGTPLPVEAGNGSRFADRDQPHWETSGADRRGFRMDFVPKTDQLPGGKAAAAIDSLFAFAENGADGKPIRADFWNRAWIYCEHAISAIELEALLFGRRRRLDPTQAGAADDEFGAHAAKLLDLDQSPPVFGQKVKTRFIALDHHIDNRLPGDDPFDNGLLMSSLAAPTSPSFDPHFRNVRVKKDDIQVGDWVRANNAAVYHLVARGGAWGAENAYVMQVRPLVQKGDRGGVQPARFNLQGHGTREETYNQLLDLLARVMKDRIESVWKTIVDNRDDPTFNLIALQLPPNPSRTTPVDGNNLLVIRWKPYDELGTIKFPRPVNGQTTISSGPWWFVLNIGTFNSATAEDMMARYPKTIGGSANNPDPVSDLPGITQISTVSGPDGGFVINPATFWQDHVLFPLFDPAGFSTKTQRDAWRAYFAKKKSGQAVTTTLVPTPIDRNMVPGILRRGPTSDILAVQPKVARTPTP